MRWPRTRHRPLGRRVRAIAGSCSLKSADPDHALMALDRLCDRVPELLARLTAAPVLARQLIMVLGASSKLSQHLIAHPEHIELLEDPTGEGPCRLAAAGAAGGDGRRPRSCRCR